MITLDKYSREAECYKIHKSYSFYDSVYSLGNSFYKICRFCGKSEDEVEFKNIAHAIPSMLNNKNITTFYECDECNLYFGSTCEDQLGKYLQFYRSIFGSKGRKGAVKTKNKNYQIYSDESKENFRVIKKVIETNDLVVEESTSELKILVQSEHFIPYEIYKAFIKIFISLIDDQDLVEVDKYRFLISRLNENFEITSGAFIADTFLPIRMATRIQILKRNECYNYLVPYKIERPLYIMNVFYEYFIFQLPIFDLARIDEYKLKVSYYPFIDNIPYEYSNNEEYAWRNTDWSNKDTQKVDQSISFGYSELISNPEIKKMAESYI